MRPPLIEVSGLSYRYPDGTVGLDGVDFSLAPGEAVALMGPAGSGKTTFLLQILGLLDGAGEITICGDRLEKRTLALARQKLGLLFQHPDDQLVMSTVLDDVAFGPLNSGVNPAEAKQLCRSALERVGMESAADRRPQNLSAGEKRLVQLAGLLAMNPAVLLLDEPDTFLDPPSRANLLSILRELPQAIILVTHHADSARALADRAAFFDRGRIIAEGSVAEIVARFQWDGQPAEPLRAEACD